MCLEVSAKADGDVEGAEICVSIVLSLLADGGCGCECECACERAGGTSGPCDEGAERVGEATGCSTAVTIDGCEVVEVSEAGRTAAHTVDGRLVGWGSEHEAE